MLNALIISFIIILLYFIAFYVVALKQGVFNTVDIAYGTGFIIIGVIGLFLSNQYFIGKLIIIGVVTIWAIRLVLFLMTRKFGKDPITHEDKRFKNLRDSMKNPSLMGFGFLYIPQFIFVMIVSLPVLVITYYGTNSISITDYAIGTLACIGLIIESSSDYQLAKFKSKPENEEKIYSDGLWKYSQHPNYFGEIIFWWSIWLASVSLVPFEHAIWILVGLLGPILITISLLKVSGIPLLNRRFNGNTEYDEYRKTTKLLIPFIY